ncbi:plasmid replication protein RepC [Aquabacter sp. CN5-332]|uniref:plasmid replication protein RepC n=1 Tax=Aquabacter sp. CN5-332 TaxID=3156608 RepID=UPI0032B4FAE4
MTQQLPTTPFGRRSMSLGLLASQVAAQAVAPDVVVHKWKVFQHIREAREAIGATDRALAILTALLSFHQETTMCADGDLVVFPSNAQLSDRANGMAPATLRRHIAVLVHCGLVIRRDSPNGKRFARKGPAGEIEQAYGFDLAPIVARADEFKRLAETTQAEKKAFQVLRERLTIARRDVVKMIAVGIEEGVPGDWRGYRVVYEGLMARLPRSASKATVEAILAELNELRALVHKVLENFVKSQNQNANESHNERHKQNSNTDSKNESEQGLRKSEKAEPVAPDNVRPLPERDLPLGIVLEACPEIVALAPGGEIRSWRDLLATAQLARGYLGISPSAYQDACAAMGESHAATVIAAILQRAEHISSHGGYLRSLTKRAQDGKFSTWPMVMALLRAKLDAKADGAGGGGAVRGSASPGRRIPEETP